MGNKTLARQCISFQSKSLVPASEVVLQTKDKSSNNSAKPPHNPKWLRLNRRAAKQKQNSSNSAGCSHSHALQSRSPPEQDPRQAEPAGSGSGGTGAGAHHAALTPSRADRNRTPTATAVMADRDMTRRDARPCDGDGTAQRRGVRPGPGRWDLPAWAPSSNR